MRRIGIMLLLATLLAAVWPSHAQQGPGRRGDRGEQMRPPQPPPQRDAGRDMRDRNSGGPPRPGQLSPEERRQLRRDIYDHGRDIYRDRGNRR